MVRFRRANTTIIFADMTSKPADFRPEGSIGGAESLEHSEDRYSRTWSSVEGFGKFHLGQDRPQSRLGLMLTAQE